MDIVRRAGEILNFTSKWNRADNRICPADAKTFSLYCALEKATEEVDKSFEHRGAAMQEARFVIEEIAPKANHYSHRLMDYNNDPTTTLADIQGVFWFRETHSYAPREQAILSDGSLGHSIRRASRQRRPRATGFACKVESRR